MACVVRVCICMTHVTPVVFRGVLLSVGCIALIWQTH